MNAQRLKKEYPITYNQIFESGRAAGLREARNGGHQPTGGLQSDEDAAVELMMEAARQAGVAQ